MKMFRAAVLPILLLYIPLAKAKVAATEWGTFTSLVGSNGVTQDGMYHEDEALPEFVHGFGELAGPVVRPLPRDPNCPRPSKIPCEFLNGDNRITQKMETPVIYFYAAGDLDVTVDVKFPEGMVSETYPGPAFTTPNRNTPSVVANGHTIFNVKVHDLAKTDSMIRQLPQVPAENIYAHARNVPASMVQVNNELENFIFYRGVGRFTPKMSITSHDGSLALHQCSVCGTVPAAFLVDVDSHGSSRLLKVGKIEENASLIIRADEIKKLRSHGLLDHEIASDKFARTALIAALSEAGLNSYEATAMIDTWENGYLKVPGLRLLYVLPRQEVDEILPVTLAPSMPFQRVFVGRIELLLDTEEDSLLGKILAARDLIDVRQLGRFAEPMLRRILQVYEDKVNPVQADLEMFDRLITRAKTEVSI